MLIVGLTGSIGMGKSETANMFRRLGVPVYDADAAVHGLYAAGGGAAEKIESAFPGTTVDGAVDRQRLSAAVIGNPEALKRLEAIIHPLVGRAQMDFLNREHAKGTPVVVLDIPLLFETGGEGRVDVTLVVSAPAEVQRARVLARPGMTEDKLNAILSKQMPDGEKRRRADSVIETDKGLEYAFEEVKRFLHAVEGRKGEAWARRRSEA